jgi:hypothetical protein
MFIQDPIFSIPDPGSRAKKIPEPGSASKNLSMITLKSVSKFSDKNYLAVRHSLVNVSHNTVDSPFLPEISLYTLCDPD